LLAGGTLYSGAGGLTMNLPGSLFLWTGGSVQTSPSGPYTNAGTMTLSGGNIIGGDFWNAGTMVQSGKGGFNIQNNSGMNNSGIIDLQNDAPITAGGGGGAVRSLITMVCCASRREPATRSLPPVLTTGMGRLKLIVGC
jgi:hypothetical protein